MKNENIEIYNLKIINREDNVKSYLDPTRSTFTFCEVSKIEKDFYKIVTFENEKEKNTIYTKNWTGVADWLRLNTSHYLIEVQLSNFSKNFENLGYTADVKPCRMNTDYYFIISKNGEEIGNSNDLHNLTLKNLEEMEATA